MKWLEIYQSENTKELYKCAVRRFLRCCGCEGESEYLSDERDHERDVIEFFAQIKDMTPLTVHSYLSAVHAFYEYYDIQTDPKLFKRLIAHRRGGAQTMDRAPTKEELRSIVDRSALHYRALFLLLSSSGLRISEALSLSRCDVDLEQRTAIVRKTKSGNPRAAFFSVEAQEYLRELFPGIGEKVFSCTANSAQHAFITAQKSAWIYEKDKNTGRSVLHLHSLRKYFFSHLSAINREMTEALMGHEGYLTGSYRRFSTEDLKEWYRENEGVLWVFARTARNERDRNEMEDLRREIAEIRAELKKRHA